MANENDMKTSTAVGLSGTESPVKSPVEVPDMSREVPGELEWFDGRLCKVVNSGRYGWWRFHEHYDRSDYCDNPGRWY